MASRLAQWKSLGPARWLRVTGILVLLCGLSGASLLYWRSQTVAKAATMDDLMPGYVQARARQRGILMGTFVAETMDDLEALREPGTQGAVLAILSTITALGCFQIASMIERREH